MTLHKHDFPAHAAKAAIRVNELFAPYFDRADVAETADTVPAHGEPLVALDQLYAYFDA